MESLCSHYGLHTIILSLSFLKNVFFSWPTDLIKEYMHEEKALSLFV
jgi:hypothetical protein